MFFFISQPSLFMYEISNNYRSLLLLFLLYLVPCCYFTDKNSSHISQISYVKVSSVIQKFAVLFM